MKKKQWIAVGIVAVVIIAVAVAAVLSTQRAEYKENDLVIAIDSTDPAGVASVEYMTNALAGTGVNVIALDPVKNPKGIPMTDQANMEVLGAMLFYGSDGEHVHETRVYDEGYIASQEDANALAKAILDGTAGAH